MARTLLLAAAVAAALTLTAPAHAITIKATSGDLLWTQQLGDSDGGSSVAFTGLQNEEEIVALDFNPANGRLYGLGRADDRNGLYVIDPTTAAATRLTPAVSDFANDIATGVGFDFNPVFTDVARYIEMPGDLANRVFTDDFGGIVDDFAVDYADSDPNETTDPRVLGLAYANNVHGAMGTTGYVYDTEPNPDVLATIPFAGDGDRETPIELALTTSDSVGGMNAAEQGGFDIAAGAASDVGYAALNFAGGLPGDWNLYTVNLDTGAISGSSSSSAFITQDVVLSGMTVAPDQIVQFASGNEDVDEGDDVAVEVERTGDTTGALDVELLVADGTAAGGDDFTDASTLVHFDAGETTQEVTIPIADDAAQEGAETLFLELLRPTGNSMVGVPYEKQLTITASDQPAQPGPTGGDTPPADTGTPTPPPPPPPSGGNLPPAADPAAVLSARVGRQRARTARRRGVRFGLSTNEPVTLVADLVLRGRRIGRLARSLTAGSTTLVLRAARAHRRKLRPGTVIRLRLTGRDAAGNVTTRSIRIRLRR